MEMIADISGGFTWQSIIVVVAIVCICMISRGICQARRGDDGKVEVSLGGVHDKKETLIEKIQTTTPKDDSDDDEEKQG